MQQAQLKARMKKAERLAAERAGKSTIKARTKRLRHLESVIELHKIHRKLALADYNALQKELKGKTTTNPREFIEQKNAIYSLAQRVRFVEELLDRTTGQAEKERKELTRILSIPVRTKQKRVIIKKAPKKPKPLTQEQKEEIDGLLDSLNKAKKRKEDAHEALSKIPHWKRRDISRLIKQLREANTDLDYIPWLLEKTTQGKTGTRGRVDIAREKEAQAFSDYSRTMRILRGAHPQITEMRIEYLKAKRTKLFEEGRTAKTGTKERAKIDAQLKETEREIAKAEKTKVEE